MVKTIGNPLAWGAQAVTGAAQAAVNVTRDLSGADRAATIDPPKVNQLIMSDLLDSLRLGIDDFAAFRSDVLFICLFYPIIGVLLFWMGYNRDMVYLMFPMISGFALIGPVAAIGLYEMSRRREAGEPVNWAAAFGVVRSHSFAPIVMLAIYLFAVFFAWLVVADWLYALTLGRGQTFSLMTFMGEVFGTPAGWTLIVVGCGVGAIFAGVVLAVTVVSFPLLLDRNVGLAVAVLTSWRVARANPVVIAAWGLIVAVTLVIGAVPLFLGLIVVLPVLGHATWHLYRRAVD